MSYSVYTGGTFDILHKGHINLLRSCKKIAGRGGKVVVALNTDEFILRYKGVAPYQDYEERLTVLKACKYVDRVIPNESGEDSTTTIEKVSPSFIVVGSDWAKKDYYKQMGFTQEWLDERDITLLYTPYTDGISSSRIKKCINEKNE